MESRAVNASGWVLAIAVTSAVANEDPFLQVGLKFPAAIHVEGTVHVPPNVAEATGTFVADLRPDSVGAQRFSRSKPMGMSPLELRYDTPLETIIYDPSKRRATRMEPFLPTVGMSAVESIIAPYGFVRLLRWQAARGDAPEIKHESGEVVLLAPSPGRGRPSVEMRIDSSSRRISRIIARGSRSEMDFVFSDYRSLADGTEFPFRYVTTVKASNLPSPQRTLTVFQKVELLDVTGQPERPAFDADVILEDSIDGVFRNGSGEVVGKPPLPGRTRGSAFSFATSDRLLIGSGVLLLVASAVIFRIRNRS